MDVDATHLDRIFSCVNVVVWVPPFAQHVREEHRVCYLPGGGLADVARCMFETIYISLLPVTTIELVQLMCRLVAWYVCACECAQPIPLMPVGCYVRTFSVTKRRTTQRKRKKADDKDENVI